jgi:hypothetical protein
LNKALKCIVIRTKTRSLKRALKSPTPAIVY